jgi:hypothetical protein
MLPCAWRERAVFVLLEPGLDAAAYEAEVPGAVAQQARDQVRVQLEGVGAGVLQQPRVLEPAGR